MKLTEMKVNDFIDLLASDAPPPGGGSASALAGAMRLGLSKMAAALSTGPAYYAEHEATAQEIPSKAVPPPAHPPAWSPPPPRCPPRP